MKYPFIAAMGFALVACAPPVPDSGAPAPDGFEGYQDFTTYRVNRDNDLNGTSTINGGRPPGGGTRPIGVQPPASSNTPPVQMTTVVPPANGTPVAGDPPADGATQPLNNNDEGISNEQDFDAVANQHSIESDAERLRRNKELRQVVEPTALPTRSGSGSVNIVQYAISTTNQLGVKVYRRGPFGKARYERNCAKYATPEDAQEAFLAAGGPERDRLGLDPDGDGFACDWDPTPFRRIQASR